MNGQKKGREKGRKEERINRAERDRNEEIHKLGRRQRRTCGATSSRWWGTYRVCVRGVSLARTLCPGTVPLTPPVRLLRYTCSPGFSVPVLGFQPRLLGDRTVTSRDWRHGCTPFRARVIRNPYPICSRTLARARWLFGMLISENQAGDDNDAG